MNVAASLQTDSFHPMEAALRKNISGSIDGDAIQKDITGASGTPPIMSDAITGITPHEQNGENAPRAVARNIETTGFLLNTLFMCFDISDNLTNTAMGIVMIRYGQIWINESNMNSAILITSSILNLFGLTFRHKFSH